MPYLVCDATDQNVDHYEVSMDDSPVFVSPAQITDPDTGMKRLYVDLSNLMEGTHTVTVRAGNEWGWSLPSDPFTFESSIPSPPQSVGIES